MAKYQTQNKRIIERAFSRFRKEEEDILREGAIRIGKAGLDFLLEAHENFQEQLLHPEETDTLGYAVAYNGGIVDSAAHIGGDTGDLPGSAKEEAERLLSGTKGWMIIVLSDMDNWYRWDWEEDFLMYSSDEIKANFNKYFKPIR